MTKRESEPFWNSQPEAVLGRARRRGRSVSLLRPPLEIECHTNSTEIAEHKPVHSDTPRVAGKVAFQALRTRHILSNDVLSLSPSAVDN